MEVEVEIRDVSGGALRVFLVACQFSGLGSAVELKSGVV